jgi:hypothetical protein
MLIPSGEDLQFYYDTIVDTDYEKSGQKVEARVG